ncbi:MAG: ribosome small subunit-dependent GTPase A [Verrucomicrobia bacterium]|nr:ribosome small subunit-dependent GTPase A [Verrucomicrobiota bacterium]
MSLRALGWDAFFEEAFAPWRERGLIAARVAAQHRGGYELWAVDEALAAEVSGKFRHQAPQPSDFPCVGDWVAVEPVVGEDRGIIQAVLPRRTQFSRKAAGQATDQQLLAANIDDAFILESLAMPPNLRRIERFLTLAWESGATPTVLLTKADLRRDVETSVNKVSSITKGGRVLAIHSENEQGIVAVRRLIGEGRTVALFGPSGVGKSTLINRLAREESQAVLPVRERDQKGRHTTTFREMVFLAGGGVLIDTPGLRELQLWEGAEGLESAFQDIESLAIACRFTDCRHDQEPGCAVQRAVREGGLDAARVAGFRKLRNEVAEFGPRRAIRTRAEESRRSKGATRSLRGQKHTED